MGTLQTTFRCWGESEPSSDMSDDSDGDGEMSCAGSAEERKETFMETYLLGRGEVIGPVSYHGCRYGGGEGGRAIRSSIGRSGDRRCCRTRQQLGLGGRGGSAWSVERKGGRRRRRRRRKGVEVI